MSSGLVASPFTCRTILPPFRPFFFFLNSVCFSIFDTEFLIWYKYIWKVIFLKTTCLCIQLFNLILLRRTREEQELLWFVSPFKRLHILKLRQVAHLPYLIIYTYTHTHIWVPGICQALKQFKSLVTTGHGLHPRLPPDKGSTDLPLHPHFYVLLLQIYPNILRPSDSQKKKPHRIRDIYQLEFLCKYKSSKL